MRIALTWLFTVASVIPNKFAMSLFFLPLMSNCKTSISRELRSESGMRDARARSTGRGTKRLPPWTFCRASTNADGSEEQEWDIVSASGGHFNVVNHLSGLVLDTNGGTGMQAGFVVQEAQNSTAQTQQWLIVPVH